MEARFEKFTTDLRNVSIGLPESPFKVALGQVHRAFMNDRPVFLGHEPSAEKRIRSTKTVLRSIDDALTEAQIAGVTEGDGAAEFETLLAEGLALLGATKQA